MGMSAMLPDGNILTGDVCRDTIDGINVVGERTTDDDVTTFQWSAAAFDHGCPTGEQPGEPEMGNMLGADDMRDGAGAVVHS